MNKLLAACLGIAALAGCYAQTAEVGSTDGNQPAGDAAAGTGTGTGAGAATGLPCDVAAVLQSKCTSCHSNPPSGGATMALITYADLTAPSSKDPTKTNAERSLARMQATSSPMPPGGAAAADVATLSAWISAGMPKGTCGDDGGAASPGDYNTPVVCTSKTTSTVDEGSQMRPGAACGGCHGRSFFGGTVYPTAHEPTNCNGSSGPATVVITGADGKVTSINVNAAGNFYSSRVTVAKPYTAKVVAGGKERVMVAAQTSGDCNSCHTQAGSSGAPGRIMMP